MATKKKKSTAKKGKSKKPRITRWWAWFLLLLFICVGGLLLYQHLLLSRPSPSEGLEVPGRKAERSQPRKEKSAADIRSIDPLELPAPTQLPETKPMAYTHYRTLYSTTGKIPLWVAYELTANEARGGIKRRNNFRPDPQLKERSADDSDYTRSGYDRGHLAPAADMAFSENAMEECFYFTNIAPQNPTLNRGSWKELEETVRRWVKREKALYITTGTVVGKNPAVIGKNRVAVPDYFYKAVLSVSNRQPKAIGFVFRNHSSTDSPFRYAVSIDSIESLTGLDLFPALPDSIEERIEQHFDPNQWPSR